MKRTVRGRPGEGHIVGLVGVPHHPIRLQNSHVFAGSQNDADHLVGTFNDQPGTVTFTRRPALKGALTRAGRLSAWKADGRPFRSGDSYRRRRILWEDRTLGMPRTGGPSHGTTAKVGTRGGRSVATGTSRRRNRPQDAEQGERYDTARLDKQRGRRHGFNSAIASGLTAGLLTGGAGVSHAASRESRRSRLLCGRRS